MLIESQFSRRDNAVFLKKCTKYVNKIAQMMLYLNLSYLDDVIIIQ